jgi:hypothetical protein
MFWDANFGLNLGLPTNFYYLKNHPFKSCDFSNKGAFDLTPVSLI